jgi:glutamine synthetase
MNKKSIIDFVKQHPSGKVKIAIADIDGILRGKYISVEKFLSVVDGQTGICDVVFGWDANDLAYENTQYTGWHTGYPDAPATIDINTFRKIPWENDVPFFLAELADQKGKPSFVCPRQLVKKVLEDANKMQYHPIFSQEFEWFNFLETPYSANEKSLRTLFLLHRGCSVILF